MPCLIAQSCLTLCNPIAWRQPGPLSMWILQASKLEWFAMLSSRGSSQSRDQTLVSHIAGRFFTVWATREVLTRTTAAYLTIFSNNCFWLMKDVAPMNLWLWANCSNSFTHYKACSLEMLYVILWQWIWLSVSLWLVVLVETPWAVRKYCISVDM